MAHVTLRIADDTAAVIDGLATEAGMTRSAWINRAINDALPIRQDEARTVPTAASGTVMVSIRLPRREVAAIEQVAERAGLTRAQWLKQTVRWQLWSRAGELRLIPSSYRSILKLSGQVRSIGRSLNQAVKAMNAANRPDSAIEIQSGARAVVALEATMEPLLNGVTQTLADMVSGEVDYWTGWRRSPQPRDGRA